MVPVFFSEIVTYENLWSVRFESIPQDFEEASIYEEAGGSKLSTFSDLILLDTFAKQYNYTHDEVFKMDWEFVYTLQFIHAQQNSIQSRANDIRQKRNKQKNSR